MKVRVYRKLTIRHVFWPADGRDDGIKKTAGNSSFEGSVSIWAKYIYIMDAYEDLDKDLEKGTYNPLKRCMKKPDMKKDAETFCA